MRRARPQKRLRVMAALTVVLFAVTVAAEERALGAWTLRCQAVSDDAAQRCIMYQNLVLKTGGEPVLEFSVGLAPGDGKPTVLLKLPLGIYLPPGIGIRIDDGERASFPVERCDPDGCHAVMKLRDRTVEKLRAGKRLEIEVHDAERVAVTMPLTLDGFGEAFDAMTGAASSTAQ